MSITIVFCFALLVTTNAENRTSDPTVQEIANNVISLLGVEANSSNKRFKELGDKLKSIDHYVIDRDKYDDLIRNETEQTSVNETNFYEALKENDELRFVVDKDPKNLYVKLKEKMNRDDIIKLIEERKAVFARSRKRMGRDLDEHEINTALDELLAKPPTDNHKFGEKAVYNKYWDPQGELNELHDYHQPNARRLYRGERTSIRNYPFMVSIHVMGLFWCGGSIYWHDIILTSASCLQLMHNNRFFRENPRVLKVRVGSNHSRIGGEAIDALEVYFHPSYNPRTLANNIAVIRLQRRLVFTYHRLPKLIAISHSPNHLPHTGEVLLLGWGVTKSSQKLRYEPVYLQKKVLPVYPSKFCKEVYGDKFITNTMFCAGTLTTGEGACDHDAGGPAVLGGRLVGIISFGPSTCGFANAPTVFTLVGAHADWIESVNESMPHYYRIRKKTTTTEEPKKIEPVTEPLPELLDPLTSIEASSPPVLVDVEEVPEVPEVTEVTETESPGLETTSLPPGVRKGRRKKRLRDDAVFGK